MVLLLLAVLGGYAFFLQQRLSAQVPSELFHSASLRKKRLVRRPKISMQERPEGFVRSKGFKGVEMELDLQARTHI